MTSNINASNIDGNYPVAGQDNNSQGFRDNFSSIKTNLAAAADEISDLQQKAILKSALVDGELNNDFDGAVIENAELRGTRETVVNLGTVTGTQSIDFSAGSYFSFTTDDDVTLEFENLSPVDTLCSFIVQITVADTDHTVVLPSSIGAGASETSVEYIIGLDTSNNNITFSETGTYIFKFTTIDNGSSVFISDLIRSDIDTDIENIVGNLSALSDVEISDLTDNEFLVYNSGNSQWENSSLSIDNITDIELTEPQDSDFLLFNSGNSQWENGSIELNNLTDINTTSPSTGDFLRFENDEWINVSDNFIYPATNLDVTVDDDGSGLQEVFYINDTPIKDSSENTLSLTFEQNRRYRFDISDPSNEDAPLRFSTEPDTTVEPNDGGTISPYTDNVVVSGDAGTDGAYVEILITENTPSPLYLYGQEVSELDTSKIGGTVPIYVGKPIYYYGFEEISSNGNISLNSSVSVVTTSDDLELTLNEGVDGQNKTIVYGNSSVGNTNVTVNGSIWGGNLALSNVGSTVTLQYINSNWYCVGKNDITFT